jgi:hypothetical protein
MRSKSGRNELMFSCGILQFHKRTQPARSAAPAQAQTQLFARLVVPRRWHGFWYLPFDVDKRALYRAGVSTQIYTSPAPEERNVYRGLLNILLAPEERHLVRADVAPPELKALQVGASINIALLRSGKTCVEILDIAPALRAERSLSGIN